MKPHDDLVNRAENWLWKRSCKVVFHDRFRPRTKTREQPDCIGWRSGISILIECKTSRSDFLADAKKPFRVKPELGMGSWRFYLCPPGVIKVSDLPKGWGLLNTTPRGGVKVIHGGPSKSKWATRVPFKPNLQNENMMLVSALRRMHLRDHLKDIYKNRDEE